VSIPSLADDLRREKVVALPPEDLDSLLEASEVLREENTNLAGMLRILRHRDDVVCQEEHPDDGRILLRRMEDRAAADAFVDDRLETYDRMWDGCGCKVEYFD
jgi:hypothetical protein